MYKIFHYIYILVEFFPVQVPGRITIVWMVGFEPTSPELQSGAKPTQLHPHLSRLINLIDS